MEDTRLETALETVHTRVTIGHMFTGKAYSHTICGHLLSTSTLLSLITYEFWDDCNSDNSSFYENHGKYWLDAKRIDLVTTYFDSKNNFYAQTIWC